MLSGGTSSRFTQTIVGQRQLALQAFAGPLESRGRGLFRAIGIVPPAGQQASPSKGVVAKGRAPVSDAVLKITLPKAQHADLANGAHLIVLEDHRVPQLSIQIQMRGATSHYGFPQSLSPVLRLLIPPSDSASSVATPHRQLRFLAH